MPTPTWVARVLRVTRGDAAAVANGDASGLEDVASTSGADAAAMLCYLHPHYDGRQPGACPTMYFGTRRAAHRYWPAPVVGRAGGGSGHCTAARCCLRRLWSPPDPTDGTRSPLWAFTRYRALNRLALRIPVTGNAGALAYLGTTRWAHMVTPRCCVQSRCVRRSNSRSLHAAIGVASCRRGASRSVCGRWRCGYWRRRR